MKMCFSNNVYLKIPNDEWNQHVAICAGKEHELLNSIARVFAPIFDGNFSVLAEREGDEVRIIMSDDISQPESKQQADEYFEIFEKLDDSGLWVDVSDAWANIDNLQDSEQLEESDLDENPIVVFEENKLSDLAAYAGLDVQDIFTFNDKFFVAITNSWDLCEHVLKTPSRMAYEVLKQHGTPFCKKENIQKVLEVC